MLKFRFWVGLVSTPLLLGSVGCSIGHRPYANANGALPPDRMMAMAQTFERQGHLNQAKTTYLRILAAQPGFPEAQQRLDTLIASESKQKRQGFAFPAGNSNQLAARQNRPAETARVSMPPVQQSSPAAVPTRAAQIAVAAPTRHPATLNPAQDYEPVQGQAIRKVDSVESTPFIANSSVISPDLNDGLNRDLPNEPAAVPPEPIAFDSPLINQSQFAEGRLEEFFGPFHIGMIERLKANREQFQPYLLEIVKDPEAESEMLSRAVFLLGAIGTDAIDAVPTLRQQMHIDSDPFVRVELSEAILKIQPEDEEAVSTLVECLKHSDQGVQWVAAFALRNAVSPRTTFVVDQLRQVLATDDLKLRRMVFLTLAEFGPAAAAAIPDLEAALDSDDAAMREVARASLECIAPDRKTATKTKTGSSATRLAVNN